MPDDLDQAQSLIDASAAITIAAIVAEIRSGAGTSHCIDCGILIPRRRRDLIPNARRCTPCQGSSERRL